MRRILVLLLMAVLALAGCSGAAGQPHPEWDESWVRVGENIGVEPVEGFSLSESNDALSLSSLYYAAWACGDGQEFVNADGEKATVYDAQIYLLLKECGSTEAAAQDVEAWIALEKQSYEAGEAEKRAFGEQEFDVLPLLSGKEGNPYGYGAAAFAVQGENAISVELVCTDRFAGDPDAVLTQFLTGFHYSEE